MNLPTPSTVVGKLVLRAVLVAVVAAVGFLVKQPEVAAGSGYYLVLKLIYDVLNKNTPTV